ncbi:MAG: competence protein ComJ [Rhodobacteraceae bacterium]|jgi:hypothetical protein|nr:competence protein ComJ [Paracoccaceae bacterium]
MSILRQQSLEVFADYHQFYVQDGGINPPAPENWTDEDIANRSKAENNVVVVCPLRSMTVAVAVELHDSEPKTETDQSDHVVECSLDLPTGHLHVHECTGGPVLDWEIPAGSYRVRLSFAGLKSISENGLEGDDSYKVELWPGPNRKLRVTRIWSVADEA